MFDVSGMQNSVQTVHVVYDRAVVKLRIMRCGNFYDRERKFDRNLSVRRNANENKQCRMEYESSGENGME